MYYMKIKISFLKLKYSITYLRNLKIVSRKQIVKVPLFKNQLNTFILSKLLREQLHKYLNK